MGGGRKGSRVKCLMGLLLAGVCFVVYKVLIVEDVFLTSRCYDAEEGCEMRQIYALE